MLLGRRLHSCRTYMFSQVYKHINQQIYIYIYICIYIYIIYIYVHVCMYTTFLYAHKYICTCICNLQQYYRYCDFYMILALFMTLAIRSSSST